MELGQATRPREPVEPFNDPEPRTKCSFCCALRSALVTGGFICLVTLPCNAAVQRGRLCDGAGWRGFLNRHLFMPLPFAAITFTHQLVLSESLWSKNRKTVFEVNWQSSLTNLTLWVVGVTAATVLSRRYLPAASRTYRLLLWDYTRTRRDCANKWMPTAFGTVTADLDWYNILWVLSLYHVLWGMMSVMLEKEMGAHYAMFFKSSSYSRWCSPRWREWRELEVQRRIQTEQVVAPSRWGTFLTNDRWRVRNN
ncbi:hypothetical protein STCU_02185 [Strigomonas culicis]|uniref:Uncharacterized protein n=2 Tax=Strigomonas culicis TaxID=28005 RepID=S9UXL8_9TRYP|nr:hypothetical protein STCU_02185 [Strigomonas culicis]|eukprot:EPY33504.1 hypothetical protein STCU_02185 [Strigomonas culicis]